MTKNYFFLKKDKKLKKKDVNKKEGERNKIKSNDKSTKENV